jgi:hypothetical protein
MMRMGLALILTILCQSAAGAADWHEAKWPFPRDAWPAGQALTCLQDSCSGTELAVARVKFGFCNCEDGVRDDAEVDYVSDVDLISPQFVPLASGEPLSMFGLRGRLRLYEYPAGGERQIAMGLALSRKCDVVAISIMGLSSEKSVRQILHSLGHFEPLHHYLAQQLGERL